MMYVFYRKRPSHTEAIYTKIRHILPSQKVDLTVLNKLYKIRIIQTHFCILLNLFIWHS